MENTVKEKKWIITPSLHDTVDKFLTFYNINYGEDRHAQKKPPLMIRGPRGVGKSLFSYLFESCFTESWKKENSGTPRIVTINIAALNPNLIESELFGYVKGSHSTAKTDKIGFVETANLLILEEIGELENHTQAKLLTFIEDGYYYRVGDTERKLAKNIQIIASTNRDEVDFRPDFYDRFIKFSIPPLHKRREDVLYYLDNFSPGLPQRLWSYELLNFLAYNWPGNVREVEEAAREIELELADSQQATGKTPWPITLNKSMLPEKTEINFPWRMGEDFASSLRANNIDLRRLDAILKEYGLAVNPDSDTRPLKNKTKKYSKQNAEWEQRFPGVDILEPYFDPDSNNSHMMGVFVFSLLFLTDSNVDEHLFRVRHRKGLVKPLLARISTFIEKLTDKDRELIENIFKYQTGRFPDDSDWEFKKTDPLEVKDSSAADKQKIPDLTTYSENELLLEYYEQLIKKCGTKKAAAMAAGMEQSTFAKAYKRLKELKSNS